jgi:hypothetical protein
MAAWFRRCQEQLQKNQGLTITHPQMALLDMGRPVPIVELA